MEMPKMKQTYAILYKSGTPTLPEALARIEALKAALREIALECSADPVDGGMCESIARAALDKDERK
jgi:hypothetical protein